MIYYRRGPVRFFEASFARSKRGKSIKGHGTKGGGASAASTKRHIALETIFRMYNFVKFCFSISGIGYGSIFVFSSIRPSSSSSRNFPFPRGKKKNILSLRTLDWNKNIHKVTMIHVQLYTIYLIEPAIWYI